MFEDFPELLGMPRSYVFRHEAKLGWRGADEEFQ